MLFSRSKNPAAPPVKVAEPEVPKAEIPASTLPSPESSPEFVPKAEFDKLQATIFELRDNVTNYFMRQNQPEAPSTSSLSSSPPIEDVSDDDYESALAGEITDKRKAAQIVQKRHKAIATREKLEIQQQLNQMQTVGMGAIGNLTLQSLHSKPHYAIYKKEIDAAISQLPPEARINAGTLEEVYNLIIGRHIDEIMAKDREILLRQAATKPDTSTPGRGGSSHSISTPASTAPSPSEVLDPYALAAIRDKYGSTSPSAIDRFVRSQGMDSWDSYYTKYFKPLELTEGNA